MEDNELEWDPDRAREEMSKRRLRMPVTFLREDMGLPDMQLSEEEPKMRELVRTTPTVVPSKKNKGSLF